MIALGFWKASRLLRGVILKSLKAQGFGSTSSLRTERFSLMPSYSMESRTHAECRTVQFSIVILQISARVAGRSEFSSLRSKGHGPLRLRSRREPLFNTQDWLFKEVPRN